ncbi:MAG: DUF4112 domain-containing protein [Ilumatobacteraceae bacterium]
MDASFITVDPSPRGTLQRLDRFVYLTDLALPVPGTRCTIGVDAVLSLVPARLLGRMGLNIAIDTMLGAIPVLGFFFDLVFRANERNTKLLRSHLEEIVR